MADYQPVSELGAGAALRLESSALAHKGALIPVAPCFILTTVYRDLQKNATMCNGPESNGDLHLADLSIRGFRGIGALEIPRLGRVTLLAGKNGVGKTTVLEACRVYAARGRYSALSELANKHEEYSATTDRDGARSFRPNLVGLFHGRDVSRNARIEIGPKGRTDGSRLGIEVSLPSETQASLLDDSILDALADGELRMLKVTFENGERVIPLHFAQGESTVGTATRWPQREGWYSIRQDDLSPGTVCVSLGPGLLGNDEVAEFWDNITLTDDEDRAVEALRMGLGHTVKRVAMIGEEGIRSHGHGRRVIVKLGNHGRPVPLKSLGDGATRLFGIALALANCRNGFLLIDEAENGIHYSVHRDYWRLVLRTARANNTQVLATTHGWDCIRGFAQAAMEIDDAEGVLVRLEKDNKRLHSVEYSEGDLETTAKQGIEVR